MNDSYDDIIHLPRPVSRTHPPMSRHDRAAQFSPFAALTGYGDAVRETQRQTAPRQELDEYEKEELDWKLAVLMENLSGQPQVLVTYFVPDERKSGGRYVTRTCVIQKVLSFERVLITGDGSSIPIDDITALDCDLF